jgi:hypothetical protein
MGHGISEKFHDAVVRPIRQIPIHTKQQAVPNKRDVWAQLWIKFNLLKVWRKIEPLLGQYC